MWSGKAGRAGLVHYRGNGDHGRYTKGSQSITKYGAGLNIWAYLERNE